MLSCSGSRSPPQIATYPPFYTSFRPPPNVHVQIEIHRANTCPISLFPKSLGVVVKAEKHGSVRYRALNAIVAAFSQIFSSFPLSFYVLVLILFHGMTRNVDLSNRLFLLSSTTPGQGGVLPMAEEGFFLRLGPWPNVYTSMGSPVCYPYNNPSGFFFSSPWEEKRISM